MAVFVNKTNNYAVEVENLTFSYDNKPVLWDINLKIPKGKIIAIIGPNGAGKTTLIKAMLGLLKPVTGKIKYFGNYESINNLKGKIGYVPQTESVDWDFPTTALDVVLMGCYGKLGWVRRPRKKDILLAKQMIKKVGMQDYASRQISQLSGGQQQRIFLARALVQEAEIYFMDEPFKGVDAYTEKAIVELLMELKDAGKTVIVVHHDLNTVKEYFDWVTLINIQSIASGPVNEVFNEENLKKTYNKSNDFLKGLI